MNGAISSTGRTAEAVVVFSCFSGYLLQGDSALQCGFNEQWNGTEPVCTGEATIRWQAVLQQLLIIRAIFSATMPLFP